MKKTKFIINIYLLISFHFLLNINCDEGPCSNERCIGDGFTCESVDEGDSSKICGLNCKPKYGTQNCYNCEFGNQLYFIDSGICINI